MPLFRQDSPYYAPLSSSAWYLVRAALFAIFKSLDSLVMRLFGPGIRDRLNLYSLAYGLEDWHDYGIISAIKQDAESRSLEADYSAVRCVLEFSNEESHLEEFFALVLGFFKSKVVDAQHLSKYGFVSDSLLEWMNRTLSSRTLSSEVKQQRISVCRKVMDTVSLPVNSSTLFFGLYNWDEFFCSIDCGLVLNAATYEDPHASYISKCAILMILTRVPVEIRDTLWCELASSYLGVSNSVIQDYLAYGDSASLANLNFLIRQAIDFNPNFPWFPHRVTETLKSVSKIDVQGTLPELRHDFCILWNKLVQVSRSISLCHRDWNDILPEIRHIYIALHPSTASTLPTAFSAPTLDDDDGFSVSSEPPSYPLCTEADHLTCSASHVHGDVVVATELQVRTSPTMFSGGKILDSDTPTHVDALSSPTPSPYYADISPANKHSLDDIPATPRRHSTSIRAPSTPTTHISPVYDEDSHSPANPFDSTTTLVIRNGIYTDSVEHTANSHSRISLLPTTSTPMLPLFSISHSNLTRPSQQDEESTSDPLSTFSYPPSLSISSSTSNAPATSARSRLSASAGNLIPAILVFFPLNLNRRLLTHSFVGHFRL